MTKARNISRFGDDKGVGSAVGDTNKIFASVSTASTVTSSIRLTRTFYRCTRKRTTY